mgnify:CR=1 FL=1
MSLPTRDKIIETRAVTKRFGGRKSLFKPATSVSAVNGVSLTVNNVSDSAEGCEFSINLIPHTVEVTTLKHLKAGSKVNLEIDLIARYVERMLSSSTVS